jgi:hypothetical protein
LAKHVLSRADREGENTIAAADAASGRVDRDVAESEERRQAQRPWFSRDVLDWEPKGQGAVEAVPTA